jgi:mycothiol synthase
MAVPDATSPPSRELALRHHPPRLSWWVDRSDLFDAPQIAEAIGLRPHRELHRLQRPLPLPADLRRPLAPETAPETAEAAETDAETGADSEAPHITAFNPHLDTARWLDINNAAFNWHPDQGSWTDAHFREATRTSWWNPEDMRILRTAREMLGFCWVRFREEDNIPTGEIFVIAVDPSAAGHGFGRALTIAGLDWMTANGAISANLWVEANNDRAIALYRSLGFEHCDTRWNFLR